MPIIDVSSHRETGKTYQVDTERQTCTCIGFRIRKTCSHLSEVMNSELKRNQEKLKSVVAFDLKKVNLPMPVEEFEEKYGIDTLSILKINQDVYEKQGKVYRI